jgi:hypothetical protein
MLLGPGVFQMMVGPLQSGYVLVGSGGVSMVAVVAVVSEVSGAVGAGNVLRVGDPPSSVRSPEPPPPPPVGPPPPPPVGPPPPPQAASRLADRTKIAIAWNSLAFVVADNMLRKRGRNRRPIRSDLLRLRRYPNKLYTPLETVTQTGTVLKDHVRHCRSMGQRDSLIP